MHQSVIDAWHRFSEPLEGRVRHFYVDVLGLVTAGVGNLADPLSLALKMPWRRRDGSLAGAVEVSADWERIKANADELKTRHYKFAEPLTNVRLTDEDIDVMVLERLLANEAILRKSFPDWSSLPADAQLALSSMSWAMGAGFTVKFPTFMSFAKVGDWFGAIPHSKIREAGNAGVVPRNRANAVCFGNAAAVLAMGLPITDLHWPSVLKAAQRTDDTAERVERAQLPLELSDEELRAARDETIRDEE